MIKRILIANRGEIASRIIRTCKRLGITSIAVYSEADKEAPFVKAADEAYLLGASQVNESYMNMDKIFDVAKKVAADAIHPAYGFFSENAVFRQRCEKEGIRFIGPKSEVIQQMGDKINARNAMIAANVPVVPGTEKAITDVEQAVEFAKEIGYPIMLKAAAGGGGIGMQVVREEEELRKVFTSNSERALNFFGNGSMFLERKIENAHHIEIQILADEYGNAVHLFDRECSIQRRNQKVIEEAPSPFISEKTRKKMGETGVQAAKAISYTNAGTIEFLVDEEENYYFLEMNTRIQVEHPVTEEITGIDMIEMQIRIANGEELPFKQEEIKRNGHAIETRIYAEDPVRFFPSPGTITSVNLPEGKGIRHDIAFTENYQVTPFYDPMIGKLIVKGETRKEAVERLEQALANYRIDGIKTNLPMLEKSVAIPQFKQGNTTTNFVDNYYIPLIQKS
ncbi:MULTISPECIES: acetyl-CoA carboxylase biotin carboxylase subunit [unclassified Oceanobacillus]|uniref:acetyl-CoA carboxylase biotin carboxylase subunit n=1 Tax=unclassified Oceanobacillus TaxID=2630292 RepID=UPI00300DDE32